MEILEPLVAWNLFSVLQWVIGGLLLMVLLLLPYMSGVCYLSNGSVGVVEKLWSRYGSIGEGRLIALGGEAGFQPDCLRGGIHFGYWPWQYRIHRLPLTVVPQGKIGYVFSRDGDPLRPEQTLGRVVPCNHFQNARAFLLGHDTQSHGIGQRGRQRAILREGVYAINLALFVVITEDHVNQLPTHGNDKIMLDEWRRELLSTNGFEPVVIGRSRDDSQLRVTETPIAEPLSDDIGIVTVHDGPALSSGQLIAPEVGVETNEPNYHSNFQDIEAFLAAGGRRGRQLVGLTDGTYFINHWFATVERIPKTIVPIGNVGVVVSFFGKKGADVSGDAFRHGERVGTGEIGVQAHTLGPGKYPFNRFAGMIHVVPTTNFVLHWITGRTETHRYDESLKSIDLVTADAYEPNLPLSVVVHIDYQKAANVVQRFGDVKRLITQTLDPLLSAYFRDIAHKKTMLELLHDRDLIQAEARAELRAKFAEFDIELVDVLIGKPDTAEATGEIETLLEQLRLRQLSREQVETYQQQGLAAEKLKSLKLVQAEADRQTDITNSQIEVKIAENRGEAQTATARHKADQAVVTAEARSKCELMNADSQSKARTMLGEAEGKRITAEGEARSRVLQQQVAAYGEPWLYALSQVSQHVAQSKQPLVPERVFMTGGNGNGEGQSMEQGLLGALLGMLVSERSGFRDDAPVPKSVQVRTEATAVTSDRAVEPSKVPAANEKVGKADAAENGSE